MSNALVLLAEAAAPEPMLDWLKRHLSVLTGYRLLANSELAEAIASRPAIAGLSLSERHELGSLSAGADIRAAALVLSGEVGAVVAFPAAGTPAHSQPDAALLIRACAIARTPLALNPASADLALRGLGRSRLAYLLFNPVAGNGDPTADLARIRSLLEPQLLMSVVLTRADGDPAAQTRELVNLIEARGEGDTSDAMVVACGGDGTVSAVAGVLAGTAIPLGVIPRGTANAFASALGIPLNLSEACRVLLVGHERRLDTALCNDTPMVLLAGLGFEAGMVERASRDLKNRLGTLAYVLAGAQQLLSQQPFQASLTIDGTTSELQAAAITVANVAPGTSVLAQGFGEVIPDDGLLEVTVATPANRLQGLNALAALMTSAVVQSPTSHPDLLGLRAREIHIVTDSPQRLVVDGEMITTDSVHIRCRPESLSVITPLTRSPA
ncbi:lipid kinase [Cyanobium sp. ATX 6A2]|uniref:diacylglycerol kinase family protein n=1 Tax=Cyanobium sp. ATX 6A2 TaxID=2823700 RepID=UPI0020CEB5F1|nr:diacylglycerol kinase family protein [Cyanobium sp. ATX 6A2]MCP9888117.1 lipid kinase [Cyanobium sp. ATX 6A2]